MRITKTPRWAYVPGRGEAFVMDYLGNGVFHLRAKLNGELLFAHRDSFRFVAGVAA